MKRTGLLQEVRKLRFVEAYKGCKREASRSVPVSLCTSEGPSTDPVTPLVRISGAKFSDG